MSATPTVRAAALAVARASRKGDTGDAVLARQELLIAHVTRLAADAPPLTSEQQSRVVAVLGAVR